MGVVNYTDERTILQVNVRPASYGDDLNRLGLQEAQGKRMFTTDRELAAAVFTYPRLVCATVSGTLVLDGVEVPWPPTPEQILEISADAINAWYLEVKKLNPTWFPDFEELEKKAREMTLQTESST